MLANLFVENLAGVIYLGIELVLALHDLDHMKDELLLDGV